MLADVTKTAILPYFGKLQPSDVETKTSATDFVTIADKKAEKLLIEGLRPLLPEACFIAEESVSAHGMPSNINKGYAWTIDPLDGTRNFVKGGTEFCTMLGLLYNGQPVGAWIYKPLNKSYVVANQQGEVYAFTSGQVKTACVHKKPEGDIQQLRGSLNAMGFDMEIRDRVREKLKRLKGRFHVGSAGIEAMNMAIGTSHYLMHSKLTYWDTIPVVAILEKLGYHLRLGPNGTAYNAGDKGVLLGAPTASIWQELADFIWSE